VREAVRMMFNFEWSNETLFFGSYERVNSFWENSPISRRRARRPKGELALLRPLVEEGLLPETILTDEAVLAPANEAAENLPSRAVRREAGRLLEEAGWVSGEDGIRTKDGKRLTMTILQTSAIVRPDREPLCRQPAPDRHRRPARPRGHRAIRRPAADRATMTSSTTPSRWASSPGSGCGSGTPRKPPWTARAT
jgi:hypothetical protein